MTPTGKHFSPATACHGPGYHGGQLTTSADIEDFLLQCSLSPRQAVGATGQNRTAALLKGLGEPQNQYRAVHVAGTAGKGSVTAYTARILRSHGFHVGAYLSPHVHTVLERFQLNGTFASVPAVAASLEAVHAIALTLGDDKPTMFETATAAAFYLFGEQRVDYAVIETGIGGQFDATNTITRNDKLAVITAIGMDHTELLGHSIQEIAAQKAGVLPEYGSAIAISTTPESDRVITAAAHDRRCSLHLVGQNEAANLVPEGSHPTLAAKHQQVNAGLAILTAEHLSRRDGWRLDPRRVSEGLRSTALPGRCEPRRWRGHPIMLDGAHNPVKVGALADAIHARWPNQAPVWVLALKSDKDVDGVLAEIASVAQTVVTAEFDAFGRNSARGQPVSADQLAASATRAGLRAVASPHLANALDYAVELSDAGVPVVVAGSFYLVNDAGKLTLT